MSTNELTEAITKASNATQKLPEPLRLAAFQTILQELLQRGRAEVTLAQKTNTRPAGSRKSGTGATGSGTTARLIALVEEGIFLEQQSLSQIRQILAERGFHYTLEELATPLTRLVRRKHLRRIRVSDGGKKTWRYSNF